VNSIIMTENRLFRMLSRIPWRKHIVFLLLPMLFFCLSYFFWRTSYPVAHIFYLLLILYLYIFTLTGLYFSSNQPSRKMMKYKRLKLALIIVAEIFLFVRIWINPDSFFILPTLFRSFITLLPPAILVLEWSNVSEFR